MDPIEQAIHEFIITQFLGRMSNPSLSRDAPLVDTEVLHSVRILTLIDFLEQQFGLRICQEDVTRDNFQTIQSIGCLVQRCLAAVAAK
jgi:acyl carrier protein